MSGRRRGAWIAFALASLPACHASRALRPLSPGQVAIELSAPGVWFSGEQTFPAAIPVVGARAGVAPSVEATLKWNPSLAVMGIAGLEVGGIWHALPGNGAIPAVHLGGELSTMLSGRHLGSGTPEPFRGAAAMDLTLHWEPTKWCWPYFVLQNALVFSKPTWISSAYAGLQFAVSERWDISGELGIEGWNLQSRDYTQRYLGLAGRGALWMSWGVSLRFDAWRVGP